MMELFDVERPQIGVPRKSVSENVVWLRPLKKAMVRAILASESHLLIGT